VTVAQRVRHVASRTRLSVAQYVEGGLSSACTGSTMDKSVIGITRVTPSGLRVGFLSHERQRKPHHIGHCFRRPSTATDERESRRSGCDESVVPVWVGVTSWRGLTTISRATAPGAMNGGQEPRSSSALSLSGLVTDAPEERAVVSHGSPSRREYTEAMAESEKRPRRSAGRGVLSSWRGTL
jgi:hypothetical protein